MAFNTSIWVISLRSGGTLAIAGSLAQVSSNIGTIADAAVSAGSTGLLLGTGAYLDIAGGTLAVAAANGNGGNVSVGSGEIFVEPGGSFTARNTLSLGSGSLRIDGGMFGVAALSQTGGKARRLDIELGPPGRYWSSPARISRAA